jgi:hypothetical protein
MAVWDDIPDEIFEIIDRYPTLDLDHMLEANPRFRLLTATYLRGAHLRWRAEKLKAKMEADKEAFYGTVVDD